ncbi:MAG: FAD-dependent monooxygenase, partial [Alphaproteobacteria bacterium]|nr:FAD-dependent monooxygenase [Alphaproteobacteria bacterium]
MTGNTPTTPATPGTPKGRPAAPAAAEQFELLIVGGGLTGMTLACALAGAGLRVAVVDRQPADAMVAATYDGRASAIAHASARVLQGIGVWSGLREGASPIRDIRVADGHPVRGISSLFLHYDHRDLGDDPFGYIIENRVLRRALLERAAALPSLTLLAPAEISELNRGPNTVDAVLSDGRGL